MSDNWNTYFSVIDNKPASFLLDLEPWKNGENEQYVYLYKLSVTLKDPNEDGVTTNKEAEALYAIEDSINDSIDSNYLFVGRVTTDGRRDFFYYTETTDVEKLKRLAVQFLETYEYSINRFEEQKPRDFYYECLFPNKSNRQRMMNRQVVENLSGHGDTLKKAREVNHWIYFANAESRNRFKEIVQRNGFQIENQDDKDDKFSLIISREDLVHFHAISEVTDYLVSTAQEYGGEYDGWETKVIKEKDSFQKRLKRIFKLQE
ncbi:hypothetical protein D3C77_352280 [compost metagenome]